jgi:hypothetical protein
MTLYWQTNENGLVTLYFEFGPSGTQFALDAILIIPFGLLLDGIDDFVITNENGDEVEDLSYCVDEYTENLIVLIPHFSYYYFARR